ncbi:MucR family transcriptional regulator [Rhodovibrio salinarum]|uniref:MucR family transcriptional regulator n=1 Tax=Rhodovibrio salinarum TaxID=1087 RepID=A0A934QJY1_9PROT|nr:MucR family transcriptional regulator [Rhodovibrio salinarum]MBK1697925.1 MucR family transcriptional regulator [Rhodovibrio salinarum]
MLDQTTDIVVAYLQHNSVSPDQLSQVIREVHGSLAQSGEATAAPQQEPAVPIKKSIQPDYLVCLEDGAKLKMLKRHLRAAHGMTPEDYRTKWGLSPDYPMVAPNYAEQRSEFAKDIGLGRKPRT